MKILMIIAKQGFRDEEFMIPHDMFRQRGHLVDVASTEKGICQGKLGMTAHANLSISEAKAQEYAGIVLVGGPGSKSLVGYAPLIKLISEMNDNSRVIAAICYAPVILARAGFLKGRTATVWNNEGEESNILENNGAIYSREHVVRDGKYVTADGPSSAKQFADAVLDSL